MKTFIKREKIKDHLFDGMSIMVGGFMCIGTPEVIVDEIVKSNNALIINIVLENNIKVSKKVLF